MPDDFDFFNEPAQPKPKPVRRPEPPLRAEPVDDEEREPPRRSRRDRDEDERDRDEPRGKKKGVSPLLIALFVVGGVVILGGGVAVILAMQGKSPETKPKGDPVAQITARPPVVVTKKDAGDPNSPSPEVMEKVKKATVRILVEFKNGKGASGSGFVEKNSRLVVTNAHVVGLKDAKDSGYKAINLVVNSGEGDKEYRLFGTVEAVDEENDLALIFPRILEVGERHVVPDGLVVPRKSTIRETDNLFVFGFPLGSQLGNEISIRPTRVIALRRDKDDKTKLTRIDVEGGMTFGNSGGPVVDIKGNVVGVAVAGLKDENIRFAVPAEKVVELLAKKRN